MQDPIVVDFEGFAETRPVLAGVLVGRDFAQAAFTDVEPDIAVAAKGERIPCTDFAEFCRELVARARSERRAICGFSRHEWKWIADGLGGNWPGDVEYLDAKRRAKAWRSARHPAEAAAVGPRRAQVRSEGGRCESMGNRLVDFVRLAGIEIPARHGSHGVTETLRRVLDQSRRHARYGALTLHARNAWRDVLEHNRLDCEWARMLVARAEAIGRPRRRRLQGEEVEGSVRGAGTQRARV